MSTSCSVHLIYGPQGAGKTTHARALAARTGGVRFSIDEWMVTLYGPDLPESPDLAWVLQRVGRCHEQIWSLTRDLLQQGTPVILDLGFMRAEDRRAARQRAEACGAHPTFHFVDAPVGERRVRVLRRNEDRGETFSLVVPPALFDFMETQYEPPSPAERAEAHGAAHA